MIGRNEHRAQNAPIQCDQQIRAHGVASDRAKIGEILTQGLDREVEATTQRKTEYLITWVGVLIEGLRLRCYSAECGAILSKGYLVINPGLTTRLETDKSPELVKRS